MALKSVNLRVGDTTFRNDFARYTILEQSFNGNVIKPGQKIRMGSSIDLVLGNGAGEKQFVVPNLIGLTYCEAKSLLEANGISIGAVVGSSEIQDTCNAFIYKTFPDRYDAYKNFRYIRSGQMMDLFLQVDRPVIDTLPVTPEQE